MHIVIMGCGRVGATLATKLQAIGHSVAIIDRNDKAFRMLPDDFRGLKVHGIGFDRRSLERARCDEAVAFAAVAGGDNSNIIAARAARQLYGVRNVVARIYDPKRAEIYERLGIATVPTARWTTNQMLTRLIPGQSAREFQDISGNVSILACDFHSSWVGTTLADLEELTASRVAFVTRYGEGTLPARDYRIQEEDIVHLALETTREGEVTALLTHRFEEEAE